MNETWFLWLWRKTDRHCTGRVVFLWNWRVGTSNTLATTSYNGDRSDMYSFSMRTNRWWIWRFISQSCARKRTQNSTLDSRFRFGQFFLSAQTCWSTAVMRSMMRSWVGSSVGRRFVSGSTATSGASLSKLSMTYLSETLQYRSAMFSVASNTWCTCSDRVVSKNKQSAGTFRPASLLARTFQSQEGSIMPGDEPLKWEGNLDSGAEQRLEIGGRQRQWLDAHLLDLLDVVHETGGRDALHHVRHGDESGHRFTPVVLQPLQHVAAVLLQSGHGRFHVAAVLMRAKKNSVKLGKR